MMTIFGFAAGITRGNGVTGEDVTALIKAKAREMGYLEVGMTAHDPRYIYQDRKDHVKYTHAICLALEQDFEETQTAPSMAAEHGHYGTYETQAPMGLEMVDYIRSLGYQAQVHGPSSSGTGMSTGPSPPHDIKVCLVKKDNSKEVWNRLSEIVGAKPSRRLTNK